MAIKKEWSIAVLVLLAAAAEPSLGAEQLQQMPGKAQSSSQMQPTVGGGKFDSASDESPDSSPLGAPPDMGSMDDTPTDSNAAEATDKKLTADQAADAIKSDAAKENAKTAAILGDKSGVSEPKAKQEASASMGDADVGRLASESGAVSKADLRVIIAKSIARSDSAQRIMHIESQVSTLQGDMRYLKNAMATLLEVSRAKSDSGSAKAASKTESTQAPPKPEPVKTTPAQSPKKDKSSMSDGKKKVDNKKDHHPDPVSPQADKKPKPQSSSHNSYARTKSSIRGISYKSTGVNTATVKFDIAGDARPRTNLIWGKSASWSDTQNWVSIDLYGVKLDTTLPHGKGIIHSARKGKHGKYVRFVFNTTAHRTLTGDATSAPGVVTLRLKRGGRAHERHVSNYGSRVGARASSISSDEQWHVRAISAGAAVIYNSDTGKLISIRDGSRVPALGVVTAIHPSSGIVETTDGRISAGG